MKKNILRIILFITIVLLALLYFIFNKIYNYENKKEIEQAKEIYLVQTTHSHLLNAYHNFKYYNEKGDLIKLESFKGRNDVSYSYNIDNKAYFGGPGGMYVTDIEKMCTTKVSKKDINIVKKIDNEVFYYDNIGKKTSKGEYSSKICSEVKCYDVNMSVSDFDMINGLLYVIDDDRIAIFDKYKKTGEIDVSKIDVSPNFIRVQNDLFLLSKKNIYKITDKSIVLYGKNDLVDDKYFEISTIDNNSFYITKSLIGNLKHVVYENDKFIIKDILINKLHGTFSYSWNNNKPMIYTYDYNQNKILSYNFENNVKEIKLSNMKNKESVYSIYRIK